MEGQRPEEENGIFYKVTNREIYGKLVSLEYQLAETNARLDLMAKDNQQLRETVGSNLSRISKLETRINGVFVGIGTGVFVAAIAVLRGVLGG